MTDSAADLSDALPAQNPLKYACQCGRRAEFGRADDVDWLRYAPTPGLFTADCPACETARPTKVMTISFVEHPPQTVAVAGEFTDTSDDEQRWWTAVTEASFEGTPDLFELLDEPFSPRCRECNALFDREEKHTGPDAPEVGWEYYECAECGTRTRAERAEPTNAAADLMDP